MHELITVVVDDASFFEIGEKWGRSIITGLAHLDGIPIALFAENPAIYGGRVDRRHMPKTYSTS